MKEFKYTIKDPEGIHARPAGILVKEAAKYQSNITLVKDEKTGNAKRIFSVMGMGIKNADTIKVTIEGSDEAEAFSALEKFFQENL